MASDAALGDVWWSYTFLKRPPRRREVCGGISSESCLGSPVVKLPCGYPHGVHARWVMDGIRIVPTAPLPHTYTW